MSDQPKKLIEVALPLDEINAACKADKDRKTGTIRNLHKWFAPMPLPAWRALLYAALIDDPGDDEKRAYHLDVIKRLVANGAELPNERVVEEARANIQRQFPEGVPTVMDPFCGGGSTLVEAQRLGLPTFGSDLNPVPVLVTRTLTQLLPKVQGGQPLHPKSIVGPTPVRDAEVPIRAPHQETLLSQSAEVEELQYTGYEGLAQDVTYYAGRIFDEAWERLKGYYPHQDEEDPISWLWARTAKCINPACLAETVLTTSWWLSKKKGELAWIEPVIDGKNIKLNVVTGQAEGEAPDPPKSGRGASFACLCCGSIITDSDLERQAEVATLGYRMVAFVAEVGGIRRYRSVSEEDASAANSVPDDELGLDAVPATDGTQRRRFEPRTQADLYLPRQRLTLKVFSDLVRDNYLRVLDDGGTEDWAVAITSLLGLAVGQMARYSSTQTFLFTRNGPSAAKAAFSRNAIPMTWDFVETAPFGHSIGGWKTVVGTSLRGLNFTANGSGLVDRIDARVAKAPGGSRSALVATDPPYFDAIGYADLSDYFYVWHRMTLRSVHPDLYDTIAAPKQGELTAIPSHHGGDKEAARQYFIDGFTETFRNLETAAADGLPMIVVYASKEQKAGVGEETRWAAILTAMLQADLEITGSWPVHGTTQARMMSAGSNAVATYVVMTARSRSAAAGTCSLQDFTRSLRRDLKPAVEGLQAAGILPVDLAQAAMGPGMQVFSRYRAVLDQAGSPVPVEQALRLINQALTEVLDEQEGELDSASRFAVTLWEKHHWGDAPFGEADQVARPQGISVDDVIRSHVAAFPRAGFVKLLGRGDLEREWSPKADARPTAWEAVHHLADRLIDGGGVSEAGALMAELGVWRDQAQALVYRLHAIAARKGWTEDQERYNALIGSWSDLLAETGRVHDNGDGLF